MRKTENYEMQMLPNVKPANPALPLHIAIRRKIRSCPKGALRSAAILLEKKKKGMILLHSGGAGLSGGMARRLSWHPCSANRCFLHEYLRKTRHKLTSEVSELFCYFPVVLLEIPTEPW